MRSWDAGEIARACGARLASAPGDAGAKPGPTRATIDSRRVGPGELFVGLRGERTDGGSHAAEALRAGAWGVLVTPEHALADELAVSPGGVVLTHPDPLTGLQTLARAWQRELRGMGARVVAITGSSGKTSTKDILAAILRSPATIPDAPFQTHGEAHGSAAGERAGGLNTVASPENLNTEIGLPLAILTAPHDTEALVLELAMRGPGQIAELTAIAEPDVGVIVNVGPAHLELLGSLEAIAGAKAELIAGLSPGATAVIPADEPLLAPHVRADLRTLTFGDGGDFALDESERGGGEVVIRERRRGAGGGERELGEAERAETLGDARIQLRVSFGQAHNLRNLLAAVAASRALGVTPSGSVEVRFSGLRGERLALPNGIVLIDDCYNANPMSMRAAIDDLAETSSARRVAVLGDMLELGPGARAFHHEIGRHASARGVEVLVTVGPLAAEMRKTFAGEGHSVGDAPEAVELLRALLREGDTVLVKGSRAVGLELLARSLGARGERSGAPGARSSERDRTPYAEGGRRR